MKLPRPRSIIKVCVILRMPPKISLSVALLLMMIRLAGAQWYDPAKVNRKAADVYAQALQKAGAGDYAGGMKMINDALAIDPKLVDGYLSLAGINAEIKNYEASVAQFEKAFALDSVYSEDYLLPYSISLAGCGRFDSALKAVNTFLATPGLNERSIRAGTFRKKTYEFALQYAATHPQGNYVFHPTNLGDSINTAESEYFPSLTIDSKTLVFTRRVNGNNEDFYESDRDSNGTWGKAYPLPGHINSPDFNEGGQNISQDGQWLIFTGCNFPEGMGSCDLYISYLTRNGWSEPRNLGSNVNSEFWESSPSLSPDKRDLYFSSSRPGGYGGSDIWVCHRDDNGHWGPPQNLGPLINTAGDEGTPFIHADNQTLYFNSNGHEGYSDKADLYVSRKQPDGSWSQPENLGYPINTIDDEGSLVVTADGKTAYYASDRSDSKGGLDIYTFDLRQDIRPLKTLWVRGQVYDKNTLQGLPSTVELTDLHTHVMISKLQTDEEGHYLVTLPAGNAYAFEVNRKGYLFYSENYSISASPQDSVFRADIPLQPIQANASIILKNVFFDTKKTDLKPESVTELDNVVRLMNENPTIRIQITGYTDSIGKAEDNIVLSRGRAVSVVNYLVAKGIRNDRLTYRGLGASHPVADNSTESGRALNRRTELRIVSVN